MGCAMTLFPALPLVDRAIATLAVSQTCEGSTWHQSRGRQGRREMEARAMAWTLRGRPPRREDVVATLDRWEALMRERWGP